MITKGKNRVPISGGRRVQRRNFVLGNQAETSSTLQRQLRLPDMPQQDAQLRPPVSTNPSYRVGSDFAKATLDKVSSQSVRDMRDPDVGAVGYRPGDTKPTFRGASIISGFPTRGNTQRVGTGNQASAKSNMPKLRPGQAKNYPSLMGGYRP